MLRNTFCHLSGIGPQTERRLWDAGILTWEDFLDAPRPPVSPSRLDGWRRELEFSRERLLARDAEYFGTVLEPGDVWRMFPDFRQDAAYLDIETDGGREQHITTIAVFCRGEVRTYVQGRNLRDFITDMDRYKMLVTFNGRSFDAPCIERQLGVSLPRAHIDVRNVLCRLGVDGGLKKCEKRYGLDRGELDGVDGYFAVMLWRRYERHADEAALETLLAYNAADVLGLETLLAHAVNDSLLETPFSPLYAMAPPRPADNPHTADPAVIRRLAPGHVRNWGKRRARKKAPEAGE